MPNIPPLISHMPDSQPLYAAVGSGGGGGSGLVLNNGKSISVTGSIVSLAPNTVVPLTSVTIPVDYGTAPINLSLLLVNNLTGMILNSDSVPVAGDSVSIAVRRGSTVFAGAAVSGAALNEATPVLVNIFNPIGNATQGTGSYVVELIAFYSTTGTTPWEMNTTSYVFGADIFGCLTS
jgi:hypothetical protein